MKDLSAWLANRTPPAPEGLAETVAEAVTEAVTEARGGGAVDVLAEAGLVRLSTARGRPGRVRESAFDLLAADALVTYACEAALEGEDPAADLVRLLAVGEVE